MNKTSARDF